MKPVRGERLRFHVPSMTRGDIWHLVDLLEGNGWCSCEAFMYGVRPCKHLLAVWVWLGQQVARQAARQLNERESRP